VQTRQGITFPFRLAAPSFVLPAGVAENSRYLSRYFPEIALLFFETEACLAYGDEDLPPDLADLDCAWHVHMPLDLPWEKGLDTTWQKIDGLLAKAAYLAPHAYVLHPPPIPDVLGPLAARLRNRGVDPAQFLVENIRGHNLPPLWDEIVANGFSICLDIGHILAYGQQSLFELPGLWDRVRMLHIYGAERKMKHCSLAELDEQGQALLQSMIKKTTDVTITLELFDQAGLFTSLDLFGQWYSQWEDKK